MQQFHGCKYSETVVHQSRSSRLTFVTSTETLEAWQFISRGLLWYALEYERYNLRVTFELPLTTPLTRTVYSQVSRLSLQVLKCVSWEVMGKKVKVQESMLPRRQFNHSIRLFQWSNSMGLLFIPIHELTTVLRIWVWTLYTPNGYRSIQSWIEWARRQSSTRLQCLAIVVRRSVNSDYDHYLHLYSWQTGQLTGQLYQG